MLSKSNLSNMSVAIIGDYFLDKFVYIDTSRTSKSLYVNDPVYHVTDVKKCAGAAGTVAKNLSNLGIGHIYAIGFVGNDGNGIDLRNSLVKLGIDCNGLVTTDACITPTYTMVLHQGENEQKEVCEYDCLNNREPP